MAQADAQQFEIGVIGLGVMGRNLLLNFAEQGFSSIGLDKDPEKVAALREDARRAAKQERIGASDSPEAFIGQLRRPRVALMLVPAGDPVDAVINEICPLLEKGDILIDGGNSYFKDTNRRNQKLSKLGIHFFGVGVSGGEEGARHGPSMMPGGPAEAYERIGPLLEAASAKVGGSPCVAYLGPGSAGHYVKMVHNGIEYGIMQLIGETYDFMKTILGLSEQEMAEIYSQWNEGDLNSYLVEITSKIFQKKDNQTGQYLINEILDVAKQKGTGMWTSQSAMELQIPSLTIDIAVGMRFLSMQENERKEASAVYPSAPATGQADRKQILNRLHQALYAAMIIVYAQGMAILHAASKAYHYQLNLETVARIWRGGCIIRSNLLENMRSAFQKNPELPNLLLDPFLSKAVRENEEGLRSIAALAAQTGVPSPGIMTALSYLDAYRSSSLPANLIQAQRDFFGAHTYERIDAKGTFHTQWE